MSQPQRACLDLPRWRPFVRDIPPGRTGKSVAVLAKDRAALHDGRNLFAVEIYSLFGERARQLRVGTAL